MPKRSRDTQDGQADQDQSQDNHAMQNRQDNTAKRAQFENDAVRLRAAGIDAVVKDCQSGTPILIVKPTPGFVSNSDRQNLQPLELAEQAKIEDTVCMEMLYDFLQAKYISFITTENMDAICAAWINTFNGVSAKFCTPEDANFAAEIQPVAEDLALLNARQAFNKEFPPELLEVWQRNLAYFKSLAQQAAEFHYNELDLEILYGNNQQQLQQINVQIVIAKRKAAARLISHGNVHVDIDNATKAAKKLPVLHCNTPTGVHLFKCFLQAVIKPIPGTTVTVQAARAASPMP